MSKFASLIKKALGERGLSHVVLDDEELLVCACGEYTSSFEFSFTPCAPTGEVLPEAKDWTTLRCDACGRILGPPDPTDRRDVALRVLVLAHEGGLRCGYVSLVGEPPAFDGVLDGVQTLVVGLPLPLAQIVDLKQNLDLVVVDVPVSEDVAMCIRTGHRTTAEVFFARPLAE